jgi:hypothetical protein
VRLAELAGRKPIDAAARRVQEELKTYRAARPSGELAAELSARRAARGSVAPRAAFDCG